MAYVWHIEQDVATVRLFLPTMASGGMHRLGLRQSGRLAATDGRHPLTLRVEPALKRPNVLHLAVDAAGNHRGQEVIWWGKGCCM